ncbi:MAG TPA: GMC family oxidoreductase N-terminal domain-containing protein, partial [Thermoleophilaceae bacterium]
MSEERRTVLRAVCDTVVPSVERADDPEGFWARCASDVGAPQTLEGLIALMPPLQQDGLAELLDGLGEVGFVTASQRSREQLLHNVAALGPAAAAGVGALAGLTLFLAYGAPDPQTGHNAFWRSFGYPGPTSLPPAEPKPITPLVPTGDELALDADVCVVGSGAGGGLIAAELAASGLKVIVLEAGGYFNESDFNQLELPAYQDMYWRGGPVPTADLNVSLYAGAGLGGGTVINWTNSLRTRPWVREQWAREHGLEGVDGADYDAHMDAIFERLLVNDRCSDLNGTQTRMKEGAEALGWSFKTILRNIDEQRYDPQTAGYIGFGDQSGAKQSVAKTYLVDAVENGAEVVVRCQAQRVLTEGGRASGVEGLYADPVSGQSARVTVRAPRVVVACGALESPALLLRSSIGGPAVGQNLHLHPCTAIMGIYGEDQRAWWGAPQAALVDEFADVEDGYGFLIESTQYAVGTGAAAVPFTSGEQHKQLMEGFRHSATFIGLLRDRGAGMVTVDEAGQAVPLYSLDDELD